MRLIFLYLYKSIKSRKFLSTLVLISLTISSTLICLSLSFSKTVEDYYRGFEKDLYGNSDFIVALNDSKNIRFGNIYEMEGIKDHFEYIVSSFVINAGVKNKQLAKEVVLMASTPKDINTFSYYKLKETNLGENEVILGKSLAKSLNVSKGDYLEVAVYNNTKRLLVKSIEKDKGIFNRSNSSKELLLVNHTTMKYLFNFGIIGYNQYLFNMAFFKVKDNLPENMRLVNDIYQEFTIIESRNDAYATDYTNIFNKPASIAFVLAIILSLLIVYFIYELYYRSKKEEFKALRIIGLSKKRFYWLIFFEGSIFGLLSIILGYLFNFLILIRVYLSMDLPFDFNIKKMTIYFISLMVISLIFSFFLTRKLIQEKKLYINLVKLKRILYFAMIFITLILALIYIVKPSQFHALISFSSTLLFFMLIGPLLYYAITRFFFILFKGPKKFIFLNLKTKSINIQSAMIIFLFGLVVISLLGFGINASKTYMNELSNENKIIISEIDKPTIDFLEKIENVQNITHFYPSILFPKASINGDQSIFELQGMRYSDISKNFLISSTVMNKLEIVTNPIILANYYQEVKNLQVYDNINITIDSKVYQFQIVGFFETAIRLGKLGIVPLEKLTDMTNSKAYTRITVESDNPDITYNALEELVKQNNTPNARITYAKNFYENILNINRVLVKVVRNYMVFTSLFISLTLFLNLSLLEIDKSEDYQKERLFGMSKKDLCIIVFLRLFILIFIAFILSYLATMVIQTMMFDLLLFLGEYIVISKNYFDYLVFIAFLFGILLYFPLSVISLKGIKTTYKT